MRVLVCLVLSITVTLAAGAQGRSHDTLTLHFGFNLHQLRQDEATRLDSFLRHINPTTDTLFVSGYTDTVGTASYNRALSMRRAQQVAALAGSRPPTVLLAAGESEQIKGGDSVNRRVVIIRSYPAVETPPTSAPPPTNTPPTTPSPTTTPPTTTPPTTTPPTTTPPTTDTSATTGRPDSVVTLKDINFYEDQAILTEDSRMFLPRYIRILRQYRSDYIEVDGFCNSTQPVTEPNDPLFKLSVKRAQLIYSILIDEGFDPSHLSYKGMGNMRSKFAHPVTPEEMHANMRVEILIFHKAPAVSDR